MPERTPLRMPGVDCCAESPVAMCPGHGRLPQCCYSGPHINIETNSAKHQEANDLYRNDGNGTWTKVDFFRDHRRNSRGAICFDANGDGLADVLVVNYREENDLYLGVPDGTWAHDRTSAFSNGTANESSTPWCSRVWKRAHQGVV